MPTTISDPFPAGHQGADITQLHLSGFLLALTTTKSPNRVHVWRSTDDAASFVLLRSFAWYFIDNAAYGERSEIGSPALNNRCGDGSILLHCGVDSTRGGIQRVLVENPDGTIDFGDEEIVGGPPGSDEVHLTKTLRRDENGVDVVKWGDFGFWHHVRGQPDPAGLRPYTSTMPASRPTWTVPGDDTQRPVGGQPAPPGFVWGRSGFGTEESPYIWFLDERFSGAGYTSLTNWGRRVARFLIGHRLKFYSQGFQVRVHGLRTQSYNAFTQREAEEGRDSTLRWGRWQSTFYCGDETATVHNQIIDMYSGTPLLSFEFNHAGDGRTINGEPRYFTGMPFASPEDQNRAARANLVPIDRSVNHRIVDRGDVFDQRDLSVYDIAFCDGENVWYRPTLFDWPPPLSLIKRPYTLTGDDTLEGGTTVPVEWSFGSRPYRGSYNHRTRTVLILTNGTRAGVGWDQTLLNLDDETIDPDESTGALGRAPDVASYELPATLPFFRWKTTLYPTDPITYTLATDEFAMKALVKVARSAAPLAPTITAPATADPSASVAFDWTYEDPDEGDVQGSYELRRRVGNGETYEHWTGSGWSATQGAATQNITESTTLTLTAAQWRSGTSTEPHFFSMRVSDFPAFQVSPWSREHKLLPVAAQVGGTAGADDDGAAGAAAPTDVTASVSVHGDPPVALRVVLQATSTSQANLATVYRREVGETGNGINVTAGLLFDDSYMATFDDYAKSGVNYEYRASVRSDIGTAPLTTPWVS